MENEKYFNLSGFEGPQYLKRVFQTEATSTEIT